MFQSDHFIDRFQRVFVHGVAVILIELHQTADFLEWRNEPFQDARFVKLPQNGRKSRPGPQNAAKLAAVPPFRFVRKGIDQSGNGQTQVG